MELPKRTTANYVSHHEECWPYGGKFWIERCDQLPILGSQYRVLRSLRLNVTDNVTSGTSVAIRDPK